MTKEEKLNFQREL